jgi:hypothetical protein
LVDTVLLHARSDADLAHALARGLKGAVAVPCVVPEGAGPPLQFGVGMQIFGLWTARSEEGAGARLQDTLDAAPRRAALLLWDNRLPPCGDSDARTPVIAMGDDLDASIARVGEIAKSLKLGIFVASNLTPPQPPAAPLPAPPPAIARATRPQRPPATPRPQADRRIEKSNRMAGRWGFVIGAIIGGAIVVAGLAPWASSLIARERAAAGAEARS